MKKTDGRSERRRTSESMRVAPEKNSNTNKYLNHNKPDSKIKPRQTAVLAPPPDGGWGWVVALSSFFISLLVDGVCFSFGIFFDDFRSEFQSSKSATSWIGSVLNGSYLIFGPIVGALVNIYGCRRVAMCGSVLACVAFFCSGFSPNIGTLIFTFGFLGGIGFGLMYLPAIVIVGYYFERRRALATGIACCGSGMGAFLFAPFSEYLLDEYGWRGATRIISGLVLNGFMFALFYRPLPGPELETLNSDDTTVKSQSDSFLLDMEDADVTITLSSEVDKKGESRISPMNNQTKPNDTGKGAIDGDLVNKLRQDFLQPSVGIYKTRSVTLAGVGKLADDDTTFKSDILRLTRSQDLDQMSPKKRKPSPIRLELPHLQRKDIFYSGSIWHLKEFKELGSLDKFRQEVITTATATPALRSPGMSTPADVISSPTTTVTVSRPSMKEAMGSIFDFHLMKSPTFLVYGLSCFLCMAGFFVPFTYMPDHAIGLGLDTRSAAFLISIIGITNTVGRVAVGFISDQPWADCLLINNVALMIGGTVTVFVPYFTHFYVLAIYSAVFGSAIAVFVSLRSIIMVELMGLEKLTTAFGFVIMFQGLSSLLGSPLAGALSDITGNYDAAFYMAGGTLFLGGVVCVPLKHVARWENRRAEAQNKMKNMKLKALNLDTDVTDDCGKELVDNNCNANNNDDVCCDDGGGDGNNNNNNNEKEALLKCDGGVDENEGNNGNNINDNNNDNCNNSSRHRHNGINSDDGDGDGDDCDDDALKENVPMMVVG